MNCSDQRNASLISPICAWPYIYITFQHSLSVGSRNLGQHRGKCKRGQAEQQESGAEWRIGWFLWWSWPQLFSKKSTWQIWFSHVFNLNVLLKSLSSPDMRVRDEEKWKYLQAKATSQTFHHLPVSSTSECFEKSLENPSPQQPTCYRPYRSPPKKL